MTDPAFTFSFHDTAHDLHGTVRSGMTLVFQGGAPETIAEEARLAAGCDKAMALWRELRGRGFRGTARQVHRWLSPLCTASRPPARTGRR